MAKVNDPLRPEAVWKEKDADGNTVLDTMVVILRTRGCAWSKKGGCTMCGYNQASNEVVSVEQIIAQLDEVLERYDGEPFVKIYTSGSFLDENELPAEARDAILQAFAGVKRLLVESRPEFVTKDILSIMPPSTTVAIGLESADEEVLQKAVRKGFTVSDYLHASSIIKDMDMMLRTYLLLKPPFLSESASIKDTLASVSFVSSYSDEVSINPVNVQRGTLVERMWRRGDYRPPWLWSLLYILASSDGKGARIISSPSGGGSQRGTHNCGSCDGRILDAIGRFSLSQDKRDLEVESCHCWDEWRRYIEHQTSLMTTVDVDRYLDDQMILD
ncbi:MAG: archaeosine synthase beta-subunit [Candidatus Methanomethylophilaceae archaeon]|nr:archaeosine synthase beta-subunit [Candidatus Methanomethylophilaceae archaeon]MDI3541647.1 archaeosine synthase beta-subunit [Candidatus Methanomethylophilaceae archaeon]